MPNFAKITNSNYNNPFLSTEFISPACYDMKTRKDPLNN